MIGHRAGERIGRVLPAGVRSGIRIDEQQHLAAAHDELIDGIQRLGGQLLGMDEHQHVDVLVDVIDVGGQRAHGEQLLDLREDGPGLAHLRRSWGRSGPACSTRTSARSPVSWACPVRGPAWRRRIPGIPRARPESSGWPNDRRSNWFPPSRSTATRRRPSASTAGRTRPPDPRPRRMPAGRSPASAPCRRSGRRPPREIHAPGSHTA